MTVAPQPTIEGRRLFELPTRRRVAPNDGGTSYGQAAVAARRDGTCV